MNREIFNYRLAILFFFVLFSQNASSTVVNPDFVNNELNTLTKQFLTNNALHPEQTQPLRNQAKLRLQAMQANLALYPNEVLAVVLSTEERKQMDPSVLPFLEKSVTSLKGTFTRLCALGDEHALRYYLKVDEHKTYAIHFATAPENLPNTGDEVIVNQAYLIPAMDTDKSTQGYLLIPPGQKAITKIATLVAYPTTGNFKTLAFLVNFQDEPNNKPYSIGSVYATLNNINDFFYENSFQKTTLSTDVVGWYTIPYNSTTNCDSIRQQIVSSATAQATAAGIDVSSYQRRMYIFPRMKTCGWAGLGYIGGGDAWGITWINGYLTLFVMGHELGHNFGLSHARALTCSDGIIKGKCNYNDSSVGAVYGDTADLMGNRFPGHFNANEKEALGWLDNGNFPGITTVTENGTFNLSPYETLTSDPKAIRIPKTSPVTENSTYYYLEYRQPIGFDSNLGSNLTKGLLIHEGVRGSSRSTYLLDAVPDGGNFSNAALAPGNFFNDPNAPGGGVTVLVNSVDTTEAHLTVTFGSTTACVHSSPAITMSPSTIQSVIAGNTATYTVTLLNKDSASCGSSTFNFLAAPVAGITSILSKNSLSVAPGETASMMLQIESTVLTPEAVYSIQVSGYNNASTTLLGAAVAKVQVQAPCVETSPTISITPNSQTGSAGSTVNYSVSVSNKNSAACSAATFNINALMPIGLTAKIMPGTLTINSNTSASANLALTSVSTIPAATYSFSANATNTVNNALTASAAGQYITTDNCIYAQPTINIIPFHQNTSGTSPIIYDFTITNNHSKACGYGLFRFSTNRDDHNIQINMSTNGVVLLPGEAYNGKITVTPNANTSVGNHVLGINTDAQNGLKSTSPFTLNYSAPPTCVHAKPFISISPSSQTGPAGGTVSYTINVTNKDSIGCAAQTFNLSTVLPASLSGSITLGSVLISPNKSTTALLQATSLSTKPAANYALTAKITSTLNESFNDTASVQYNTTSDCVYSKPTFIITPISQSTTRSNSVNYNFTIKNNNTSACRYGLFRFSTSRDDHNVNITMSTNGENILAGKSYTGIITVTPNVNAFLGKHTLAIITNINHNTSIIKNEFNLIVNNP